MRGPTAEELWNVAQRTISQNIVHCRDGRFLTAGAGQFRSIWVRDFCYSIPALFNLREEELVKEHLQFFLVHQRKDGLVARAFDVINPKHRVVANLRPLQAATEIFGGTLLTFRERSLKPYYHGEHDTIAADSNLLVLNGILDWTIYKNNMWFFEKHADALRRMCQFITRQKRDGLLFQPEFSDWQDSARRSGSTFYLNLLYLLSLHKIRSTLDVAPRQVMALWPDLTNSADESNRAKAELDNEIRDTTQRLFEVFFDQEANLFRDRPDHNQFSLETNLWCIEHGLFKNFVGRSVLWDALKNSRLYKKGPGVPIYPPYKLSEISRTCQSALLFGYHDRYIWSWLTAEALKISAHMEDLDVQRDLVRMLSKMVSPEKCVHEIYDNRLHPAKTPFYQSERHFTWGAAKIIESLYLL